MAKALKPLIFILFLCSIASLVLGILLFMQREALKGRTQKLENAMEAVARKIRYDEFKVEQVLDYESMDAPLRQVAAAGENLYDELQDTKQTLENTRQDLAQTRTELADTRNQLAQARDEIASLSESLAARESELAVANTRIGALETQAANLETEVQELTDKVALVAENLDECEANYESLERDYKQLVEETTGVASSKGLAGTVLVVNPAWNFVVLDIGSDVGLVPTAEMLVHRADQLVGRVRVSSVDENMAVAEILGDWQKLAIRQGDHVVSPES